jgi:hypothetical protein
MGGDGDGGALWHAAFLRFCEGGRACGMAKRETRTRRTIAGKGSRMSFMESCSRTQCSFEVSAPTREARTTRACSPPHAHGRPLHVALPECRESGLSRPPAPWCTGKTLLRVRSRARDRLFIVCFMLSIKPLGVVVCRATQHFHFYHFVFHAKFACSAVTCLLVIPRLSTVTYYLCTVTCYINHHTLLVLVA